jgi:hypothetical protein
MQKRKCIIEDLQRKVKVPGVKDGPFRGASEGSMTQVKEKFASGNIRTCKVTGTIAGVTTQSNGNPPLFECTCEGRKFPLEPLWGLDQDPVYTSGL